MSLGHVLGCAHAPGDPGGQRGFSFDYARGYKRSWKRLPRHHGVHCGYPGPPLPSCRRLLRYSSPLFYEDGRVTGTASQDCARGIDNVRQAVANWRQSVATLPPPASAPPSPPSSFTTSTNGSVVTFSWQPPSAGTPPTSYLLEAGTSFGQANVGVLDLGSPATMFVASVPAGQYYLRVRIRNAAGVSRPSMRCLSMSAVAPRVSRQRRLPTSRRRSADSQWL